MTDALSPTMSLALRLEHVLHAVYGSSAPPAHSRSAAARVQAVLAGVRDVERESKPVRQLLESWDAHAAILRPTPQRTPAHSAWDDAAKTHHLLTLYPELVAAADDLAKIDALVSQRDVLGAGNKQLQRTVATLTPQLQQAAQQDAEAPSFEATHQRLLAFVAQYNDFTTTMSQIFLALDEQVLALEKQARQLTRT